MKHQREDDLETLRQSGARREDALAQQARKAERRAALLEQSERSLAAQVQEAQEQGARGEARALELADALHLSQRAREEGGAARAAAEEELARAHKALEVAEANVAYFQARQHQQQPARSASSAAAGPAQPTPVLSMETVFDIFLEG